MLRRLVSGLAAIDGVVLYGPRDMAHHGAAVSFNLAGRDPAEVGFILDHEDRIAVRVGLHCAPDAHRTIGTYPAGTVRVSPGYFTQDEEIDVFLTALRRICRGGDAG